jgi:3-oxoacyl-ACP reductase-like protein
LHSDQLARTSDASLVKLSNLVFPDVAAAPVAVPPPTGNAGPAASIEDVPIRAVDILAVIISQKMKKQLSEAPPSKSIKELSNGKSIL